MNIAVHDAEATCRLLARARCVQAVIRLRFVISQESWLGHVLQCHNRLCVHAEGMDASYLSSSTAEHAEHVHARISTRLVAEALPDCGPQLASGLQLLHHCMGLHMQRGGSFLANHIAALSPMTASSLPFFPGKAGNRMRLTWE